MGETYAQAPAAAFTTDVVSGCSPLKVKFTDQSTGGPTAWEWNLGNGTISKLKDPQGVYFTPGTYQVTLTVSNAAGKSSKTASITVFENPKPAFLADKRSGCTPLQVRFTDQSTTAAGTANEKWLWDFGNGTQSSDQNPTVRYINPGTYTVVLKVTNDKGCSGIHTEEKYISVGDGLALNFTTNPSASCQPPYNIQFNNSSTGSGSVTYQWLFGDGATSAEQNPSHVYTTGGIYTVKLVAKNNTGCTDTLEKSLNLSPITTDFRVSDTVCVGSTTRFTNASSPAPVSSVWTFPDGSTINSINAVKTFSTPGSYKVRLTNTYGGCTESTEKTITVGASPVASFRPSSFGQCSPNLNLSFENLSQNAVAYEWNFGDSSAIFRTTEMTASHFYSANGTYLVTLTAYNSSGCSNVYQADRPIRIGPPSVAIINPPDPACVPFGYTPQIKITTISDVASYQWNFGDGTIKTGSSSSHVYTIPGNYTASVTITTIDGCSATASGKIQVGAHSVPQFKAEPREVCAADSVRFTNLTQPEKANFFWVFGDGGSSEAVHPAHAYSDTGWFQVKLVVDNNGCRDSILSEPRYIHIKPPVARFSLKPACATSFEYQPVDQSIFDKESEGRRTWRWVFPDGSVSSSQVPPPYVFPGPGEYIFSLTVSNGSCVHTTSRKIMIMERTADITFNNTGNCYPVNIAFKAATPPVQNVLRYQWQVGDLDTVTVVPNLNYSFNQAGSYNITLTTTDEAGCVSKVTKPVLVSGPRAAFARTGIEDCKKLTATFSDSSKAFGASHIVRWKWDFGDGTRIEKTNGGSIEHVYAASGKYSVKLLVTDAAGCADSVALTDSVRITTMKADGFITTQACNGFPVRFENKSEGDYVKLTWDFGDSTVTTEASGTYQYKDTGSYDIRLVLEDAFGCRDSMVRKNLVRIANPVAAFTVRDSISFCPPFDVLFTNTSKFYGPVEWRLGDEVSNEANHRKLFTQPGAFKMVLTVKSPDGNCSASASKTITLYRKEDARMQYDPLQACMPGIVNLSAFDELASARFFWDFGDGNILDTTANVITHVYTGMGTYTPKIILTESSGCVITLGGQVPIQIKGVQTAFTIRENFFCDSGTIHILDSTLYNEPVQYHWDFGDGTTSNLAQPKHQYTRPGLFSVLLTAQSASGCTDSMRIPAPIRVVNSPVIGINGDSVICIGGRLQHSGVLERQDTAAVRWIWNFPNGSTSGSIAPAVQQYNKAGSFAIQAIAVNGSGCADTATRNITVHALPLINMPENISTPVGRPVPIPATYSSGIVRYHWMPGDELSCTDCPLPVATPKFNNVYSVQVTDSNGCKNREDVKVTVLCEGVTVFIPNTFSPNGDGRNDQFYIRGQGIGQVKMMQIYNRWGEIVFEQTNFPANSAMHGWNGTFKGRLPQEGVYVYQLQLYCGNGQVMHFSGNVALIQ